MQNSALKSIAIALSLSAASIVHAEPAKKLLTIVTCSEPQTQLMAMVLTFQAVQQGAEAHIIQSAAPRQLDRT